MIHPLLESETMDMHKIVGTHHVLFMTLDALRFDVAQKAWHEGTTPQFNQLLPMSGWQKRHSPGNFTYAAHHAFFSGFLPTPVKPGIHPRTFATQFAGSRTTSKNTFVFDEPNIVLGLKNQGYFTLCIGGVGFFNKKTALSKVFPDMFMESHWRESFGVTHPDSTRNQFGHAMQQISIHAESQKLFLFINVAAIHQPNHFYLTNNQTSSALPSENFNQGTSVSKNIKQENVIPKNSTQDNLASHRAALEYVDKHILQLVHAFLPHGPLYGIVCSDHGTAYGEQGYFGHRHNHPVVTEVPYTEFIQTP